jgi:hypothetical protein
MIAALRIRNGPWARRGAKVAAAGGARVPDQQGFDVRK